MLLHRSALEDAGGFDERFFLLLDEVELCRRLASRGWTVAVSTQASILHKDHSTLGKLPAVPAYYASRNLRLFWELYSSYNRKRLGVKFLLRYVWAGLCSVASIDSRELQEALIEGYLAGLMGRYGKRRDLLRPRFRRLLAIFLRLCGRARPIARLSRRWKVRARNRDS